MSDELFEITANLLEENSINYWVSHGTLLGIVRENRILPWDHDIDFSVWKKTVDKDHVRSIFIENGFIEKPICGDMDCLHFIRAANERMVDISFYDVEDKVASIRWAITSESIFPKILLKFLGIWQFGKSYDVIEGSPWSGKNLVLRAAIISSYILPEKFKSFLYDRLIKRIVKYIGYSYPVAMLENLGTTIFNGKTIPVPNDSAQYLEDTYGADWRTPKKDYVWYEEAENLKIFDETDKK